MGRLYNTLDNIERGRRACIDNLNAQGITTSQDTGLEGIANQIKTGVAGEGVFTKEALVYADIEAWIINIPQLDTSQVTNMGYMFANCKSLVNIPQLDTSQVTNMADMFDGCKSLTKTPPLNVGKVTSMSYMFRDCSSLQEIDISLAPILPNCRMDSTFSGIPADCLIKVYDEASKQKVLASRSSLTNVVVVNK